MKRHKIDPAEYGISMTRQRWVGLVAAEFRKYKDAVVPTVDELLIHPARAIDFCKRVEKRVGGVRFIPNSFVLRTLVSWRKGRSRKPTA